MAGKPDALGAYRREELERLQRHPGFELLRPVEAQVLRYVVRRYLNGGMGIFASQATIASKMRLHEKTVSKALRAIVKAELLTVEHRGADRSAKGGRTTNRYLLVASEDNIQRPADSITSPALDSITDSITSEGKDLDLQGESTVNGGSKEVLRTSSMKERSSKEKSLVASKEAPRVASHFSSGEVFEVEEEPQLAADSLSTTAYTPEDFEQLGGCLAALYSPTHEQDSELLGVEPRRSAEPSGQVAEHTNGGERMAEVEGVVVKLATDGRGRYWFVFADGREFGVAREAVSAALKFQGRHVRFPVNGRGNVAARPKHVLASTVEGEATSYTCFSCREPGVLHWVSVDSIKRSLFCSDCRAEADEKERRRQEERQQPAAEALPWERAASKPQEQASRPTDDTPPAVERLPWDEPEQAPATKSDLERVARKIDELPLSIAIAVGGHPADEAERATAEEADRPA